MHTLIYTNNSSTKSFKLYIFFYIISKINLSFINTYERRFPQSSSVDFHDQILKITTAKLVLNVPLI